MDGPATRGSHRPLRGRDADGRMVREPRRDSAKAEPRPPPRRRVGRESSSASVSYYGGGRGEGRDVVSIIAANSPWLSQATRTVDLRSPVDRRSIAVAGDRMAKARLILTAGPRRGHFKLRPALDADLGRHENCFSLALISSLRIAPSIRRLVGFCSKAGGPQPARLFVYRVSFVEGFVEDLAIAAAEQQQAKNSGSMREKTSGECR